MRNIDINDPEGSAKRLAQEVVNSDDPVAALHSVLGDIKDMASMLTANDPFKEAQKAASAVAGHLFILEQNRDYFSEAFTSNKLLDLVMEFMDLPFLAVCKINPLLPARLIKFLEKDPELQRQLADMGPVERPGIDCLLDYVRTAVLCGERHDEHLIDHHGETRAEIDEANQKWMNDAAAAALKIQAEVREYYDQECRTD